MITEDRLKLAQYIGQDKINGIDVPFRVQGSVRKIVEDERFGRCVKVDDNWEYYQGNHTKFFQQRRMEDDEIFKARKNGAVIPNYCEFIINLGAKYLYGRPDKVRRNFTKANTDNKTEQRLREIENIIGAQQFWLSAKRQAGIFSEIPVRFVPVDKRDYKQLTGIANDFTYPQPIMLDPRYTFCLRNKWGKIVAVVIEDEFIDFTGLIERIVKVTELIVEDSRWIWHNNELVVEMENKFALNNEFVVLDNSDTGKDDIQAITNLQIKLDEAMTDISHFFEKHGWPQLLSSFDLSNVISSPGYIWELTGDNEGKISDNVEFLTWDGKIKEAIEYADKIEAYILKMSSTAAVSTGDLASIGQLRSGAALISAHGPSIQKAQERQVIWEENERRFWTALVGMDSKYHNQSVGNRFPEFSLIVKFPGDFVPGEELIRAEIDTMALNAHIMPLRDILRKNNPCITEDEVNKKREEIFEDSEKLTDSKRAFVTESKEPISSGEKKSKEQPKA